MEKDTGAIGKEGRKEYKNIGTVEEDKDTAGPKYVHRYYSFFEMFIIFIVSILICCRLSGLELLDTSAGFVRSETVKKVAMRI